MNDMMNMHNEQNETDYLTTSQSHENYTNLFIRENKKRTRVQLFIFGPACVFKSQTQIVITTIVISSMQCWLAGPCD